MKKRCYKLLVLLGCLFIFSGCGKKEEAEIPVENEAVSKVPEDEIADEETTDEKASESEFSFADLRNIEFWFGSGAGGWRTVLAIEEDGSFSGEYSDFDAGAVYQCEFSGKFTEPIKENEYTYSTKIDEISYKKEVGMEETKDGILYTYTEPYGLEGAENILIYLPGTPVKEISEDCYRWLRGRGTLEDTMEVLPFYALNNETQQEGFSSYDVVIEDTEDELRRIEHVSENVEEALERGKLLNQADYNIQTEKLYTMWDEFLNKLWGILKEKKDAEFMETLLVEQREWIKEKEKAITEAAAEVEGGSMEPMIRNLKAVELTKERVYELMKLLEE